jgi:hypothetical protein
MMSNAKKELLEVLDGEEIEYITMRKIKDGMDKWDDDCYEVIDNKDAILTILDKDYDMGYGGEEVPSIYAWTKTRVIIKGCYDGSEWFEDVPRNPNKEIIPESVGGG